MQASEPDEAKSEALGFDLAIISEIHFMRILSGPLSKVLLLTRRFADEIWIGYWISNLLLGS